MSARITVHKAADGLLKQQVDVQLESGLYSFVSDVDVKTGGDDAGPDPHDLLDSALGACTALTVMMVAKRRQIPLQDIRVQISHVDSGGLYALKRVIELVGELSEEQRQYLLTIANKCPIHKALHGKFEVETALLAV